MSFHKIYQELLSILVRYSDVAKVNTGAQMKVCVKMQANPVVCLPVIMTWSVIQRNRVIVQTVMVR